MTAGTENLRHSIARTGRLSWRSRARIESVIEAVAIILIGFVLLGVFS